MSDFYVIAACHTIRDHEYITLWRPDDCGYTPVLPRAGKYGRDRIEAHLDYYNGGEHIAIPVEVLDRMAVDIPDGFFDYAGPGIPNTKEVWQAIKKAVVYPTRYPIKTEWRQKRDKFGRFTA